MNIFLKIQLFFLITIYLLPCIQSCFELSCEECSSEGYGKCTKCQNAFKLINGTCPCNDPGCAICKSGYNGLELCIKCKKGYTYNNGKCDCSVDYCEKCSVNGCIKCIQGRYLIGGLCKKCIEGCASCSTSETCDYCLSGFELIGNNKCIKTNIFGFELKLSNDYKNKSNLTNNTGDENIINKCDNNCEKCSTENTCTICKSNYSLINGSCSFFGDACKINFGFCNYCNENKCFQCNIKYKLKKNGRCEPPTHYYPLIICFLCIGLIIIGISIWCNNCRKRTSHENPPHLGIIPGQISNVFQSTRTIDEKKFEDEFENQKIKNEKGEELCQFCKKKQGKYICDCGCIVCAEHSKLKKAEGGNEDSKICFVCGKIVKEVKPKHVCEICMENVLNVAHFECNCALEVCEKCYVKCKLESGKCPACRKQI